jgi:hypothetical protein
MRPHPFIYSSLSHEVVMISNSHSQSINQAVFLAITPFCNSKPFIISCKQLHESFVAFTFIKNDKSKSKRDKEQNKIKNRPLCVTCYVKKKVFSF